MQHTIVRCVGSDKKTGAKPGVSKGSKPFLFVPLPNPGGLAYGSDPIDAETAVGTTSVSSDTSIYSDDPSDSHLPSPHASDYEFRSRTAINSPSRCVLHVIIVRSPLWLLCSLYMLPLSWLHLCLLR